MAKYAYEDVARKNKVYAKDALRKDRGKVYFCPNPNCTAHLYLCGVNGSNNAYFRATRSEFPHVEKCPYGLKNDKFDPDQFDETEFIFDNLMDSLCVATDTQKIQKKTGEHNKGDIGKHPLRTLRQIYSMCKSYDVSRTYSDKK